MNGGTYCYHLDGPQLRVTQFTNFGFLRILRINGKNYGFTATGRYLIGGDDDNGAKIQASFTLAPFRPKDGYLVRCPWLHFQGDQIMTVKVHVNGINGETHGTYTGTRNHKNQGRVKLPHGVKSGLWSFTLANVKGQPLHLTWLDPTFEPTTRRI